MKKFNLSTLQGFDGDFEQKIYIANDGIVYDVTDCPKWRTGLHECLHFGGQDLSDELANAPHNKEVFKHPCVKVIGILEDK
ncbi:MAG: cytochrome B5 [Chloroflexi bacterium]|jgi:predicted heme/steroid binding protein|nr:cytochrome B5 [Chloroflexota bacterium]MBT4003382.1 cytochrome B5 [Chloroflexota bacterium]MBT4305923.1 cytochrome B5 [Chloroflexota bacterium]MBT4533748.1 cytochrome B5 [Chloroflexota bacterium]MBT4681609.1 cytochrome B5 [Chloroflexota bacterium]